VIKEKIEVVILAREFEVDLSPDEGKARAEFD
jgi:hypothetical protein